LSFKRTLGESFKDSTLTLLELPTLSTFTL